MKALDKRVNMIDAKSTFGEPIIDVNEIYRRNNGAFL